MSLKHGGEQSDSAPPLAIPGARLARREGRRHAAVLAHRERRSAAVPIVGAGLDGGVHGRRAVRVRSCGAEDIGRLARLRDYRARLLRLRACVVPASRVRERRAVAAARRRLGGGHATPASLACAAIESPKAARPARRGRHGGRIPELAAHRDPCDRDCARGHDPRAAQARAALGPSREPRSAHGALQPSPADRGARGGDRGVRATASGAARCSSSTSISSST